MLTQHRWKLSRNPCSPNQIGQGSGKFPLFIVETKCSELVEIFRWRSQACRCCLQYFQEQVNG